MKKGTARSTPGEMEIKARLAQLTALNKTLLEITAQHDLTKLLQAIVQRAVKLLKGTSGGLYLCDSEKQECTCVVSYKTQRDFTGTVLKYGEGAAGKVAAIGQPLLIEDYCAWEGRADVFESEQPFRAVLAAPLLWHGGVTGVIDVLREQPFTQADLELLTMFASQAAIAIENTRALEAEHAARIQAEKEITERKHFEEQYRTIVRTTLDGFWIVDMQGRFLDVNDAYCNLVGYSREELLTMSIPDIEAVEKTEETAARIRKIMEVGGDRFETRHRCKDGRSVDIEVSVNYMKDDERMFVFLRDITERKRAEEQLRYQAALLVNVNDAIVASDAQYRLTAWNAAAESLYGWKAEQVLGQFGLDITQTEYPGVDKAEMLRIIAEIGRWRGEATQARKDGTRIPVEVSSMVLRDESGQITGYVSVNRDITERKRAEEEIAHLARFPAENPNPVLRLSRDGIMIYANSASDALLGMWDCAVGSHAPQSWRDLIAQALACGENKSIDVECAEKVYSFFVAPVAEAGYVNLYGRDITERKRAEEALREAEAWFRTTLYSIGDAVITTDAKSRVQQMNPVAEALIGWREAEARGKPLAEVFYIVNEETRRAVENPVTHVLREGVVIGLGNHTLLIARDGTERPIADAGAPIHNDRGEAVGVVLVFRDQTAERAAQKALRESERKLRLIAENATDVIFAYDMDRRLIYVNPALEAFTGYTVAELEEKNFINWLYPEDEAKMMPLWEDLFAGKSFSGEEFRIVTKDGQIKWCLSSWGPLYDESGRQIGVQGRERDITERKRAEEALRESEEKYRILVERANDGIAIVQDTIVEYVNPSLAEAVGYTIEELIGTPFADYVHPDDLRKVVDRYKRRMAGEAVTPVYEVAIRRKDGSKVDIEANAGVMTYQGKPAELVIVRDLTERKRAEEGLRESRKRLARLSRNLVEAQEGERRRIARELHDEVGQNLTALTISLDSVSQLASDGIMRGKITEIQELTKNLIAEVNALSVELRPRVLDDLGLIPGLLSLFSRFSMQTGVEIDFKHTGIKRKRVTPEIEISAYRIIQEALTNVVRHAGVKTASVRLQVEGDILYIQVQDEGKGFDLKKAMKAEDSMGLLSMIERAEQVGGHLEVETAPGEGTTITYRLPLGGSHIE